MFTRLEQKIIDTNDKLDTKLGPKIVIVKRAQIIHNKIIRTAIVEPSTSTITPILEPSTSARISSNNHNQC